MIVLDIFRIDPPYDKVTDLSGASNSEDSAGKERVIKVVCSLLICLHDYLVACLCYCRNMICGNGYVGAFRSVCIEENKKK